MGKNLLLLGLAMGSFLVSFAQDQSLYENDAPLLYRREAALGFTLHTSGMGAVFRRGKHMTVSTKRVLEAELVSLKHPKEEKTQHYEDSKPFVFGKMNYVTLLRAGVGFQNVLYSKGDRNGVEVRLNYSGGLSLGITRPVYLYIIPRSPGGTPEQHDRVIEQYDPEQHSINRIYGRAEYSYGLSKLSFHPGGYAKMGFSFEYGKSDNSIKALEVGAALDVFPSTIPIMAFVKNNPYYFSLYLSLFYGNKW